MSHIPVMLKQSLKYLNVKEDGIYVDCTLGFAGHSSEILARLSEDGHLFAFDQDTLTLPVAKRKLSAISDNYTVFETNFVNLKVSLNDEGIEAVDGIFYDLGVSSHHFDEATRGFTYKVDDAPLDMRMDIRKELTASIILNTYSKNEIRDILFQYGEERFAPKIADIVVKRREEAPIKTTGQLVDIIKSALPHKILSKKGHPAKKTFQALRIAVNRELDVLKTSLKDALEMLKPGGRLVVISFHSLEDRIVKKTFKSASTVDHPIELPTMPTETPDFKVLHKKVIWPTEEELAINNRAHSAKLRAIEKVKE